MAEPSANMVNPMLALSALYKKDGRGFNNVIEDVAKQLNTYGMELDAKYIKEKVLPFVYSLIFMTTCQQLLHEYIQGLGKPKMTTPPTAAKP